MKQAHSNVRGPGSIAIHELFDKDSTAVEIYSDLIAEILSGVDRQLWFVESHAPK